MRKKIGKRIGPVPIALVAVLALAAFISAGLWLAPNGAQAQGAAISPSGESISDLVIDIAEPVVAGHEYDVTSLFDFAEGVDDVSYDASESSDDDVLDDTRVTISDAGIVTFPGNATDDAGTTIITVTGSATPDGGNTPQTATATFDVVVVQNPIEVAGDPVTNPDPDPATTDVNEWPDGDCEVTTADGAVFNSRTYDATNDSTDNPTAIPLEARTNLVSGGDCLTSEDSVDVSFTSTHTMAVAIRVYVTGGDDLTGVEPALAKEGLNEHSFRLPDASPGDESEEIITVSRSMADRSGIVYLVGYGTPTADENLDDDSSTFGGDAEFVVKAVFLDPPVEKDAEDEVLSEITFDYTDSVTSKDTKVMATIEINDANDHPISGFVSLTVAGGDSVVFTSSNLKTHRARLSSSGMVTTEISGLPRTGPFKIMVTAEIGGLTLEEDIVRTGDAMTVEATVYACAIDRDDEGDDGEDRGVCASEIDNLMNSSTSDDPDEVVALGPNDSFVIGGKAIDAAGNNVGKNAELSWEITDDADNADDAEDTLDDNGGRTLEMITVNGSDEAVPGTYSLTVTSPDGEASTVIIIIVSDVASVIDITCDPEMIPTATGLTDCSVMVTDANGNIPSNLRQKTVTTTLGTVTVNDTFRVAVRSRDAQIIGVNQTNDADLNARGMGNFSILLREDAAEGSSITVSVSSEIGSTTLRDSTTVMYGDPEPPNVAPMAGAAVADQTVYVGAEVMVQSNFSDPDEDMLSYMASSSDDMIATAEVDDMGMVTITGVAMGTATITVTASDPGELYAMQTIMVSVMTPNMAPMAGAAVADQMVYVGAMVEVQSNFSDPDEDMLSYMASSDMMDVATATVDDMGMVTITGVAEGMATITVTASDPMGESAMQTIMVTVMMMPPMELGAPSITSVMSDADGMATVMLMPGDNATKHYIWAQPTDLSQGMYSDEAAGDADMATISGLTSGMNYWFIAVAGRGTGTDSEWSAWSGWTAETPVQ